ncbi:MAG: DUF484 family protein [Alphaproteobacteria bacterium]|jgi:hypothetical protein|nr:DUF484 family protein [Alphaproteobacteria bacterium]
MSGERSPRDAGGSSGRIALGSDEIKAYLRAHPEFLCDNPELVETLTPPAINGSDQVRDLQQYMVLKSRDELRHLRAQQEALVDTSRANQAIQAQVHSAVLTLVEARSFEHLIHLVTTELAQTLDVDVVTICVETTAEAPVGRAKTAGVYVLEPHGVDSRIGQGREVLLANDVPADPEVFGPAAGLVRSQALARLRAGRRTPEGLLALGSRDREKFHPGQGAELLNFLAALLERLIRGWLKLSS